MCLGGSVAHSASACRFPSASPRLPPPPRRPRGLRQGHFLPTQPDQASPPVPPPPRPGGGRPGAGGPAGLSDRWGREATQQAAVSGEFDPRRRTAQLDRWGWASPSARTIRLMAAGALRVCRGSPPSASGWAAQQRPQRGGVITPPHIPETDRQTDAHTHAHTHSPTPPLPLRARAGCAHAGTVAPAPR